MNGKAHGLSFLLNPRLIGEDLSATKRTELENILIETPMDNHTPIDDLQDRVALPAVSSVHDFCYEEKERHQLSIQDVAKGFVGLLCNIGSPTVQLSLIYK